MTWFPEIGKPSGGHRLITRAYIAIGDLVPMKITKLKGKKSKGNKGRIASSRISKVDERPKRV